MQHGQSETAESGAPTDVSQPAGAPPRPLLVERTSTPSVEPLNAELVTPALDLKPSGPKSEIGRRRSSRNSITHGIFSDVTVLPGESRQRYLALLKDLREALLPVGGVEDLLVEKLVAIAWRHRRLLNAESAEIRRASDFYAWDETMRQSREAKTTEAEVAKSISYSDTSLIREIRNPVILKRSLELLSELRQNIKATGFDRDRDSGALSIIYGSHTNLHGDLKQSYDDWAATAELSEEERESQGCATPEQCTKYFLSDLSKEIGRLQTFQRQQNAIESKRAKLEVQRRCVPESKDVDRLLKYEASLERSFDRTLNQLERIQRQRRGQPVPPRIDVNISTES